MSYSDETRFSIYHQCPHLTAMQIGDVIRALENTAEQKALRADAERWKHILKLPFRSVWQLFCVCLSPIDRNKAVDEAIDKARDDRGRG